ncbi:uncharacterized protein LOC113976274 [Neopelma chrysocephalum]|uniref:uncharacterized protein LOC113976274 n=1 Tax=Neopelma chrysocephalum TaxID=114329 RepID=UPI000FCD209B|nr:uncharacterized protein LOC113976274 [Neopelma chrysocephalum]
MAPKGAEPGQALACGGTVRRRLGACRAVPSVSRSRGPHGPPAQPPGAVVEAAPACGVLVAAVALRDGAEGAALALEPHLGRVTVSPPHLGAQLWDWGPCPAGAGSWLKALCGSAHQQPWGHGDITPGSALRRADVSCSLPQVLLICYKSCWDSTFQATEELGTSLQLRLEGSEEEEEDDGSSDSVLEPGQPVVQWQGHGDASEAVLERLEGLEADVRFLCTELGAEKLLWSSRFLELLREQQSLRQRVSAPRGPSPPSPLWPPSPSHPVPAAGAAMAVEPRRQPRAAGGRGGSKCQWERGREPRRTPVDRATVATPRHHPA